MQATIETSLPRVRRMRCLRMLWARVLRFVRAELKKPSPVLDRIEPDVRDRSGFGPLTLR